MNLANNTYFINTDQIIFRKEYFGGLLFDRREYNYVYLDEISSFLLENFQSGHTPHEIFNIIEKTYCIDANQFAEDIMPLINTYIKKGYLTTNASAHLWKDKSPTCTSKKCLSAPIEVVLNPGYICNQKCLFCYLDESFKKDKCKLSVKNYESFINKEGWNNVFSYSVLGGEPFLNYKYTLDMFNMLNQYGFNIGTTTNGTTVSGNEKSIAIELSKLKSFEIAVSLESCHECVHDMITSNPGGFKKALQFIKVLIEYIPNISINTVINNYNYHDLFTLAKFSKELGVKVFRCTYPMPTSNTNQSTILDSTINLNDVFARIEDLNDNNFKTTVVRECSYNETAPDNKILSNTDLVKKIMYSCAAGNRSLEIDANGDIFPCGSLLKHSKYNLGNALEDSFESIWMNPKLKIFRSSKRCMAQKEYTHG